MVAITVRTHERTTTVRHEPAPARAGRRCRSCGRTGRRQRPVRPYWRYDGGMSVRALRLPRPRHGEAQQQMAAGRRRPCRRTDVRVEAGRQSGHRPYGHAGNSPQRATRLGQRATPRAEPRVGLALLITAVVVIGALPPFGQLGQAFPHRRVVPPVHASARRRVVVSVGCEPAVGRAFAVSARLAQSGVCGEAAAIERVSFADGGGRSRRRSAARRPPTPSLRARSRGRPAWCAASPPCRAGRPAGCPGRVGRRRVAGAAGGRFVRRGCSSGRRGGAQGCRPGRAAACPFGSAGPGRARHRVRHDAGAAATRPGPTLLCCRPLPRSSSLPGPSTVVRRRAVRGCTASRPRAVAPVAGRWPGHWSGRRRLGGLMRMPVRGRLCLVCMGPQPGRGRVRAGSPALAPARLRPLPPGGPDARFDASVRTGGVTAFSAAHRAHERLIRLPRGRSTWMTARAITARGYGRQRRLTDRW